MWAALKLRTRAPTPSRDAEQTPVKRPQTALEGLSPMKTTVSPGHTAFANFLERNPTKAGKLFPVVPQDIADAHPDNEHVKMWLGKTWLQRKNMSYGCMVCASSLEARERTLWGDVFFLNFGIGPGGWPQMNLCFPISV